MANPWNGKVVLEAFHWDCWNNQYPGDWYTFLAKLAPRLRALGFDGIWTPPPVKGSAPAVNNMGYFPFDYYDIGQKNQQGSVPTRFGTQDAFLRLIAVAHANGLEVYPDIVLDHCDGGALDASSPQLPIRSTDFHYSAFAGANAGRWPKSWLDFHANPVHWSLQGDWPQSQFGPDICYQGRCSDSGNADPNCYMRSNARAWFVWFVKQTGVDGFRFDDVKGFPPEVVEDLLYNAMGASTEYFCVGEFVDWQAASDLDDWASATLSRSGTFDYYLRNALVNLVESNGYFDVGSLPSSQQQNRYKTVPFVNNHDVYRGAYWDSSGNNSQNHDQRSGNWAKNSDELAPTIDPDNPRARLAYAVAFAVDGSPQVYYEDLFVNFPPTRNDTTGLSNGAKPLPSRPYVENLVWCHQKLEFKTGAYKVRYQGSQQLLVIERSAKAVIAINNDGSSWHSAWVATDFGPNVQLHDYSGATPNDLWTNQDGWVNVSVPPTSYCVWGPVGATGGFNPSSRRTTQEFQLDDDLGDADPASPGYGGALVPGAYRTAGAVWVEAGTALKIAVYLDGPRAVDLQVYAPDAAGAKSRANIASSLSGAASPNAPLNLQFVAVSEGYFQLACRLSNPGDSPVRAYVKVEYQAPANSTLF